MKVRAPPTPGPQDVDEWAGCGGERASGRVSGGPWGGLHGATGRARPVRVACWRTMSKVQVSDRQRAAYERLLATHPEIELKGRNLLYTSVNGHMFTMFSTEGKLGIRLPTESREAFLADFDTELLLTYGTVMKEYVTVPDDLLADTGTLAPYLARSYDYVSSLKPKPTKRTSR